MDHLSPGIQFIPQVQYLVDENHVYDSQGFHKFPNRTGWKLSPTGRWECESDKSRNPTSFLQAWLFFGLLSEFLGQDSQFKSEEYRVRNLSSRWIITTENLPRHLREWRERTLKAKDDSTLAPLAIQAGLALDEARSVVSKSCSGIHHDKRIDDMVALSLMILGETLSNALSGVLNEVQTHMTGWYLIPAIGWGDSKRLLSKLELSELERKRRWCSRSAHYLTSTLRHSASGILFAMHLSIASDSAVDHGRCSTQRCDARNDDRQSTCSRFTEPCQCKYIGPDLDTLVNIIEQDQIPLLTYNSHDETITVTGRERRYTIVSHVWSDGLGNDAANELPLCRVKGLVEAVKKLEGSKQELTSGSGRGPRRLDTEDPFWIDTLAIPVQAKYKDLRKRAIKNMYRVYQRAESTLVVDKGLMSQRSGSGYSDTAMRISRCLWMTRLWTLQEAYLSKELYFIFEDTLVEMERLEKEKNTLDSPLSSAASVYYQGLLGAERQQYLSNPYTQINPDFIASVWKAVQWRNTAHSRHETLALAMLLRFRLESFDTRPKASSPSEAELEGLMQNLLKEIDSKNAIPSGFIFLPGNKLAAEGFRWAPRSWMTGQELEDPSPLKSPNSAAHLIKTGLQVKYPGFRLHNTARLQSINGLFVPTDKSLNNWLSISCTDHDDSDTRYSTEHLELITMNDKMNLNREIALLVTIQQGRSAQIIQRVWVRIEANPQVIQERKDKFMNEIYSSPWAESLPPDTIWEVDGPEHEPKSSSLSDLIIHINSTSVKALTDRFFRKRTLIS